MSQWTLPPFFDISSAEFLTLKAERAAGNWAASALSGVLDCRYLPHLRSGVGTATATNGHGHQGAAVIAVTGRRPCEDDDAISMPKSDLAAGERLSFVQDLELQCTTESSLPARSPSPLSCWPSRHSRRPTHPALRCPLTPNVTRLPPHVRPLRHPMPSKRPEVRPAPLPSTPPVPMLRLMSPLARPLVHLSVGLFIS
jgi:hypothetical protein